MGVARFAADSPVASMADRRLGGCDAATLARTITGPA
jgi:hypothetical protein